MAVEKFDVREWSSSKIYNRGVKYFRDDRVVSFEMDEDDGICAEVQGTDLYTVKISWDDDGTPEVECDCPYTWEPLCKHAVAVLLYWNEKGEHDDFEEICTGDEEDSQPISFNRESYISELSEIEKKRRRSSKLLKSVRLLKKPKRGLCGEYTVKSAAIDLVYSVMVRDLENLERTTCNCADYLINELGTCKHIETVKSFVVPKSVKNAKRRDPRVWISVEPKNTYNCELSHYEEIHIHSGNQISREKLFDKDSLVKGMWSEDGYLRRLPDGVSAAVQFEKVIAAINRCLGNGSALDVVVAGQVKELVERIDAESGWKTRVDAVIHDHKTSPEWQEFIKSLNLKLYEYQEEGILFAIRNRRSFIGDDMGLGKTVQAIVSALFIKRVAGIKKVLIFCPASLKFQWKREIEKISGEKADIVQGNKLTRKNLYNRSEALFLIVNYELIFRDEDLFHELSPDMVILDEAQRIKNWDTKTAKGIKRLRSPFALILTGTPFENKLVELHSLCEFLHPRALGPMWRLMPTYGNLDRNEKLVGYSNLAVLRRKIAPFFLRREKKMVLSQLPDKITNEYAVEISKEQLSYHEDYEAALAKILSKLKRRPLTPDEIKRAFMCLTSMRIISNALAQHDWKKYTDVINDPAPLSISQIRSFHSPKLMEFRTVMEELFDRHDAKFVIFSQWERMLLLAQAVVRDLLDGEGYESVVFSGSLPARARPKVIDRFINDPKLKIFFSTDAGGLGLNLQESASYVINLEMPWNPAVLDQRIGRVHRLGQKNKVNVINFISTGCIEERVYSAVCNKRKLFEGVFDGETDNIDFEKGSGFIDRLKEMMDVDGVDERAEEKEIRPEIIESLDADSIGKGGDDASGIDRHVVDKAYAHETETKMDFDISGVLGILGSLLGGKSISNVGAGAVKLGVDRDNDELKLTIKKPPRELLGGIKKTLLALAEAIDG